MNADSQFGSRAMRSPFLARVNEMIVEHRMLTGGERVLVAVSGGADSVALLLALKTLAPRWGTKLHACHVNHQLRGKESDGDERFVQDLCRTQGIPCTVLKADVRAYAREHRLSIEEAGRNLRYALLEQTADKLKLTRIAVAHTADDNAETVVMNLIRGSGLTGISGIPVTRGRVIRPLLEIERKAIERFLSAQGISWRRDSSNNHLEFRRNLIRHKVMPILSTINPQVTAALSRTARLLRADDAWLDEQARTLLMEPQMHANERESGGKEPQVNASGRDRNWELPMNVNDPNDKRQTTNDKRQVAIRRLAFGVSRSPYLLDTAQLLSYNLSLRRRILKLLLPELDADAVEAVLKVAAGPTGKSRVLKHGWVARKEHDGLSIRRRMGETTVPGNAKCKMQNAKCRIPGRTVIPELRVEVDAAVKKVNAERRTSGIRLRQSPQTEVFDLEKLTLPLVVRQRQKGDRMIPFRPTGEVRDPCPSSVFRRITDAGRRTQGDSPRGKKLKEILIDDKIPWRQRDRLPVLCDQQGILWVVGSRRANRACVARDTRNVLTVSVTPV